MKLSKYKTSVIRECYISPQAWVSSALVSHYRIYY